MTSRELLENKYGNFFFFFSRSWRDREVWELWMEI